MKSSIAVILFIFISSIAYGAETSLGAPVTPAQPQNSTPGAPVDDTTIMTKVQNMMTQDATLAGSEVTVASQEGVVTLRGTVSSQKQLTAAISDARSVAGVKDVKSEISINPDVTINPNNMPAQ